MGGAVKALGFVLLGIWGGLALVTCVALADPLRTGQGQHPAPLVTAATPYPGVPPDPGTGPYPACWVKGPIPGQPCPPKPPGWVPPP